MSEINNISPLHTQIQELILEARATVARTVNFVTVGQNWGIGRMIVEEEQGCEFRAEYGKYIIKELSIKLTTEFGNSYDEKNLRYFRQFFLAYHIDKKIRTEFENSIRHTMCSKLQDTEIEQNIIRYALRSNSHPLFQLSTKGFLCTKRKELKWKLN
jgi:hypothetical protein